MKELKELQEAFDSLSSNGQLSFKELCLQTGVSIFLGTGDIYFEKLESVWLTAYSNSEKSVINKYDVGIDSSLDFIGFIGFLSLCENDESSILNSLHDIPDMPSKVVRARHNMLSLLRSIILCQAKGIVNDILEEKYNMSEAKSLHSEMLKKSIEIGLYKRGSLLKDESKSPAIVTQSQLTAMGIMMDQTPLMRALDLSLRKDMLKRGLQKKRSSDDLLVHGINVRSSLSGNARSLEHNIARNVLKHKLQNINRPSKELLKANGIILPLHISLEHRLTASQIMEHLQQRPTINDIIDKGVISETDSTFVFDENKLKHEAMKHRQSLIAEQVQHQLNHREPLEYLEAKGIFIDTTPTIRGVERAFVTHSLVNAFSHRPEYHDIVTKGILVADETSKNTSDESTSPAPKISAAVSSNLSDRRDSVAQVLSSRASIDALKDQGIYQDKQTAIAHKLERQLIHDTLNRKLGSPDRPSQQSLEEKDLKLKVVGDGCNVSQISHLIAARQLKHQLENRMELVDIKAKGFYVDRHNTQEGYEILKYSMLSNTVTSGPQRNQIDIFCVKYTLLLKAVLDVAASHEIPIETIFQEISKSQ